MRKIFISLLLLSLASSCEQKKTIETSSTTPTDLAEEHVTPLVHTQTLRLNLPDDPTSFDPRLVRNLRDLTLVKQIYEGLMRNDVNGTLQPALAEKIEISEDQRTYTFTLKTSYWSNGAPLTAHDFKNAWTRVLEPSFASDYSFLLYPIKNAQAIREGKQSSQTVGIFAPDDHTLIVELHTPTPYFLEMTAFPTFYPVSEDGTGRLLTNGPFKLKEWIPQTQLVLEKNPMYWDASTVSLDEMNFSIISDNLTEYYLFEKGELDWVGQPISANLPSDLIGKLKESQKLDSYNIAGTFWVRFNTRSNIFANTNIRKAFSLAINRRELIAHILQGNQMPATGPVPPCMSLQSQPYFEDGNVEEARLLFQRGLYELGLTDDALPEITYHYSQSERGHKIAQLLQEQWKRAFTLPIHIQALELHVYRQKIKEGSFQFGSGEWIADFNDPLAFLERFKYAQNETSWKNDKYTFLLDAALSMVDSEKRQDLLRQAESLLVDEMPIAPLYHYAFDYAKKESVKDVVLSPLGIADFKYAKNER